MRSNPLFVSLLAMLLLPLSGCVDEGDGYLSVKVTDAPGDIADFSSVIVTITEIKVHKAGEGGESDSEGNETGAGWESFDVDASKQDFDLVELLNGNTTELLNATLAEGTYTQIRLVPSKAEGTLKDGTKVTVSVPKNSLKIVKSFEIAEGKTTTFVADINVVKDGKGYKLSPVIGKTSVSAPE